jgi:hypothetical protein
MAVPLLVRLLLGHPARHAAVAARLAGSLQPTEAAALALVVWVGVFVVVRRGVPEAAAPDRLRPGGASPRLLLHRGVHERCELVVVVVLRRLPPSKLAKGRSNVGPADLGPCFGAVVRARAKGADKAAAVS